MPVLSWMTYRERARLWRGFDEVADAFEKLADLEDDGAIEAAEELAEGGEFKTVSELYEALDDARCALKEREEALRILSTYDQTIGKIIDDYLAAPAAFDILAALDAVEP